MILKGKIESYLRARDCTGLLLRESHGSYIFTFTRENEYVKTTDEFEYDLNYMNPTSVFRECYPNHDYTRIIENPEFQKLIKSVGLEFIGCRGGYKTEYTVCPDEFQLKDEIEIYVRFKLGSGKVRVYDLDLDRIKLSEDYKDW